MADAKGTARNAYLIEVQMKAAVAYIEEAQKALRIAMDTFQNGENAIAGEMTNFLTLQRILSSATHDANWITERWTETRIARENG